MYMKHLAHRKDAINCSYYLKLRVQDLEKFFLFPFVTSKGSRNTLGWLSFLPKLPRSYKGEQEKQEYWYI